jgi:hypothetical protein
VNLHCIKEIVGKAKRPFYRACDETDADTAVAFSDAVVRFCEKKNCGHNEDPLVFLNAAPWRNAEIKEKVIQRFVSNDECLECSIRNDAGIRTYTGKHIAITWAMAFLVGLGWGLTLAYKIL